MIMMFFGAVQTELFPASNSRREHGASKMRVLRISANHLRLALKTRFGLLAPPSSIESHLQRIGVSA